MDFPVRTLPELVLERDSHVFNPRHASVTGPVLVPAALAVNTVEVAQLSVLRQQVYAKRRAQTAAVYGSESYIVKSKHVIVHTAPSIRATLGECFGMPIGSLVTGKMVAALKRLGFAGVYDTNVTADLTIMEEATELLERVGNGGKLPLITSCSPGWVKFCEHYYPDMLENVSSCKSPQQMFGAVAKTWYAEKMGRFRISGHRRFSYHS